MSSASEGPQDKKGNGDLSYHLHRLLDSTDADASGHLLSSKAIQAEIRVAVASLSDDLLPKFLRLHNQTEDRDLQAELAEILAYRWATKNEVQLLLSAALQSENIPLGTVHRWVTTLQHRLMHAPELSQDAGIRTIVANTHVLLARYGSKQEEDLTICAMNLLKQWVVAFFAHSYGLDTANVAIKGGLPVSPFCHLIDDEEVSDYLHLLLDADTAREWVCKLRSFFERHREAKQGSASVQADRAKELLRYMGEDVDDAGADAADDVLGMQELFSRIFAEKDHTLSVEEEEMLAEHVLTHPLSHVELLTETLRDKPYLFLHLDDEHIGRIPFIVAYLEKEAHLTHVALNISPENEREFRAFLGGGELPAQIHAEGKWIEICREWLKSIDQLPGIEWAFVGCSPNLNPKGEVALDQQVRRLAALRQANSSARVLALHCNDLYFSHSITKQKLIDIHDGKYVSIVEALAEAVGKDRVASVKMLDENGRFDGDGRAEDGEIGEFCRTHGIITSFGIRPEQTPLRDKCFDCDYQNFYADSWDGLLVMLSNDQDEEEPVEDEPDPSFGKSLSASGVLV